jgi:hypothetical protein
MQPIKKLIPVKKEDGKKYLWNMSFRNVKSLYIGLACDLIFTSVTLHMGKIAVLSRT